ncbi:MAG: iron(III) transport system ATP-binding protein [Myxococcota bacterium]|jgi:iron(III) transport system ATP-binding protein
MSDSPLAITGLSHRYGDTPVLSGVSFTLNPGEFVAILGASGCGKTTLLRAIAGLLTPEGGRIDIGGRTVAQDGREKVGVEKRGVGLVFQDYALFPQMSVADNVGFGLPRAQRAQRVAGLIEVAGLTGLADRRPAALSGGQQQRVALIRALAPRPHLLLLDEPFANVDAERRATLGARLIDLIAAEGAAALLVTHDRTDALQLTDRVIALTPGPHGAVIAQDAAPEVLYRRPASREVAHLTGPCWFLDATATGTTATTPLGTLPLREPRTGPVTLMVRPEQARLDPDGPHTVLRQRFIGRGWVADCETPSGEVTVESPHRIAGAQGRVVVSGPVWALPQ